MDSPPVRIRDAGPVRILALDRPQSRNALGAEMVRALDGAVLAALAAPEVRALVLTGSGTVFCAGADLKALASREGRSSSEDLEDSRRLERLFLRVARSPKPTVAAVNGPALAGGCGLASLCDVVIASPEARFGYPEVKVGFVAAMVLVVLQRAVGQRLARELLLSGRILGAQEAVDLGLARGVVPAGEIEAEAIAAAVSLCEGAPSSVAWTKELMDRTWALPLEEALDLAAQVNALARWEPDMAEGIASFMEKRNPSWRVP
jgi:methylglutaconyl-CoA hydratase